jgi:hypothetical protein
MPDELLLLTRLASSMTRAALATAAATWAGTAIWSVPMHEVLGRGFEERAHRRPVRTNALRVAAWSVHSIVLLAMTPGALR